MPITGADFLVVNGVSVTSSTDAVPKLSVFLESTSGAYTTTRTHSNASILLFWDRHIHRLSQSVRILADRNPGSFNNAMTYESIMPVVQRSLEVGLGLTIGKRRCEEEEVMVTTLVDCVGDAYVHMGVYVPMVFGDGARVAVVGKGRELAEAKYSEWVKIRKYMEKFRPPLATELLLSNDGDQILEGSVSNFFVVCRKANNAIAGQPLDDPQRRYSFEVQTAPISDGVLPGIVRQLVIDICFGKGIPLREVAPKWSEREHWQEAFLTNSLRLVQHVEMIQVPGSFGELKESWKKVSWVEKWFGVAGAITTEIQQEILERASDGGYSTSNFI